MSHPRVVDPDIDRAEVRSGGVPQLLHLIVVGHIAGLAPHPIGWATARQVLHRQIDRALRSTINDDVALALQKFRGQPKADAACAAGNHDSSRHAVCSCAGADFPESLRYAAHFHVDFEERHLQAIFLVQRPPLPHSASEGGNIRARPDAASPNALPAYVPGATLTLRIVADALAFSRLVVRTCHTTCRRLARTTPWSRPAGRSCDTSSD